MKNELNEFKNKFHNLKKDSNESIHVLNIKLNNYSTSIDKDTKYLIEEKNKDDIDIFNQNKE